MLKIALWSIDCLPLSIESFLPMNATDRRGCRTKTCSTMMCSSTTEGRIRRSSLWYRSSRSWERRGSSAHSWTGRTCVTGSMCSKSSKQPWNLHGCTSPSSPRTTHSPHTVWGSFTRCSSRGGPSSLSFTMCYLSMCDGLAAKKHITLRPFAFTRSGRTLKLWKPGWPLSRKLPIWEVLYEQVTGVTPFINLCVYSWSYIHLFHPHAVIFSFSLNSLQCNLWHGAAKWTDIPFVHLIAFTLVQEHRWSTKYW